MHLFISLTHLYSLFFFPSFWQRIISVTLYFFLHPQFHISLFFSFYSWSHPVFSYRAIQLSMYCIAFLALFFFHNIDRTSTLKVVFFPSVVTLMVHGNGKLFSERCWEKEHSEVIFLIFFIFFLPLNILVSQNTSLAESSSLFAKVRPNHDKNYWISARFT